jgi:hypothetical protein
MPDGDGEGMMGRSWIGIAFALMVAMPAGAARLTVTASKGETLYSKSSSPDCTALSATADAALPFNVVRLRATLPPGVPPEQVRFQWSLPVPNVGVFAADEDLGPDAQSSVVRTLCADVGNQCLLTAEQLAVYNRPTILWLAPTCDALSDDTSKPASGGRVRINVKAFRGKRKAGKGNVTVGWGRTARATLLVADQGRPFRDGIGKPAESIYLNPIFGALLDTGGAALPAISSFDFDSAGGDAESTPGGCGVDPSLPACTAPGEILYSAAGKYSARLDVGFEDGSALCDKLTVTIRTAPIPFSVDVTTSPPPGTFEPGQSVGLRVRVRNTSDPGTGGNILITGNAATCTSEVKVGDSTLQKTTQIDLQHCSASVSQPCMTDADCAPPECPTCEGGEVCLTSDHCRTRLGGGTPIGCANDIDCQPPRCRECDPGDTCVKVLPAPSIFLGVGDVFDVVDSTVQVDNTLPSPARVTDTWTANTFNAGSEMDAIKYTIGPKR